MFIWAPTVDNVGAILRARTMDDDGNEIGTFNADTRPTYAQCTEHIETIVEDIQAETGAIPDRLQNHARRTAALGVAALVELTYWPNEINSGRSPYKQLDEQYQARLKKLVADVQFANENEVPGTGPLEAEASFDDCPLIGIQTRF